MNIKKQLIITAILICSQIATASNNHYLPLKTDPLFELELEKLATVAKMPLLAKPYHLVTVQEYLNKISSTHPELFHRIKSYLLRYKKQANITQLSIQVSSTSDRTQAKNLNNARGQTSDSNIKTHLAAFWQPADNFSINVGGTLLSGDSNQSDTFIPHNTYVSYTHDYVQVDIGYKELWLSPFQQSAMLLSTQAEPIARFSISSPRPLTDWKLRYDISFGKLEEMQGIRLGTERFAGRPGFLTMHFSSQPLDWWTLGISRTLVFGGGPRQISAGDVWEAIIDPVNSDNCGGDSNLQNCEEEAGNQQASLSSKFDLDWGMPLSIYVELAGEDTNNFKPYLLGNKAYNLGLFLPYLTPKSSLLAEYQHIENAWYVHSIYQEGYRNNLHSMGHWWGDEKLINDGIGARIFTLKYDLELSNKFHFDLKIASIENLNLSDEGSFDESIYQRGFELTLGLSQINKSNIWRYELYSGKDVLGENFTRLSLEYAWQ